MVQLVDRNLSGTYGVDRLGVPRWSSGKLEQKERMKRMRTYRVMKSKKGDKMQ